MRAVSSMLDTDLTLPIVPNLRKRKSADLLSEPGQKRLASMPHSIPQAVYQPPAFQSEQSPRLILEARAAQAQSLPSLPHQQHIQPRPPPPPPPPDAQQPSVEGYGVFQSNAPSNGYGVFQSNPTGRKRGRPSKAEKEAQARASVGPLTPSGPIPITPKPAIQPTQGAPTPSALDMDVEHQNRLREQRALYAEWAASQPSSAKPKDPTLRGGSGSDSGGQGLPPMAPYSPYPERMASTNNAEKSPSIGNLVTADPPAESPRKGGEASQQAGDHKRDSPPPVSA